MDSTDQIKQPVLIITGMHRSGTSLTASLLQNAGLDIGQHLFGEGIGNLKGHFENLDFLQFHRQLLHSLGVDDNGWTEEQLSVPENFLDKAKALVQKNASSTQPWGWKEPRTVLFLDFWRQLLPQAKFLLIYRSPWEVVDSLYRRGEKIFYQNPELALKMWTSYNQRLIDFYNRFPEKCLLINLVTVIESPELLIESIKQKLGVILNPCIENVYDDTFLKREPSGSHRPTLIQSYFPDAFQLYQQLNRIAGFTEAITDVEELASPTDYLFKDWLTIRQLEHSQTWLKNQFQETQVALSQTQGNLDFARNQITQLQTDLSYTQGNLDFARNQITQLQEQLQQTEVQLSDSQRQATSLQTRLANSQAQITNVQTRVQRKQEKIGRLRDKLKQAEEERKQLHEKIAAMESSKLWQARSAWMKIKRLIGLQ